MSNPAADPQYVAILQCEYYWKQEFLFLHQQLKTDSWLNKKTIQRAAFKAIDILLTTKLNPLRSQLGLAPIHCYDLYFGVKIANQKIKDEDETSDSDSDSDSW